MEHRRLGRVGHESSVAVLGCAAFWAIDQDGADEAVQAAIDAGVNHVDIAPSYGEAELRFGHWAKELDQRGVLIGEKTQERTADGARAELERSLGRFGLDRFRLYQLHAVVSGAELDRAMPALEAIIAARDEGMVDHIGITGHGWEAPAALREALRRFPFATVMFPINPQMWSRAEYRSEAESLLREAATNEVGVLVIKAAAKQAWEGERRYNTWYEPYDDEASIADGVRFALSQPVTGFCTPGDTRLLPAALAAAEGFTPLSSDDASALIERAGTLAPVFG